MSAESWLMSCESECAVICSDEDFLVSSNGVECLKEHCV